MDQAGNVYVADTGNAAIRMITSGGTGHHFGRFARLAGPHRRHRDQRAVLSTVGHRHQQHEQFVCGRLLQQHHPADFIRCGRDHPGRVGRHDRQRRRGQQLGPVLGAARTGREQHGHGLYR